MNRICGTTSIKWKNLKLDNFYLKKNKNKTKSQRDHN